MFNKTLQILIFLSITSYLPLGGLISWEVKFIHLSTIILFFTALYEDKIYLNFINKNLIIYLMSICLISTILNNFNSVCMFYLINIFLLIILFLLIFNNCDNIYETIKKPIVFACLANLIVLGLQYFNFNFILKDSPSNSLGGIMGNGARYSAMACICLPFIFEFNKIIYIIFFILSIIFSGYKEMTIVLPFLLLLSQLKYNKKIIIIILIILMIFSLIYFYNHFISSILVRVDIYKIILIEIFNKPLIGHGIGFSIGDDRIGYDSQMYSSYLQFIYQTGLFGCIFIYNLILYFIKFYKNNIISLSLLILILLSFIEYPFEIKRLWLIIICIVASFIQIKQEKEVYNVFQK